MSLNGENTTIAVIIATYSAGWCLPQALASVAAQIDQPDEVIVVDDGSRDNTTEVCDQWASILNLVRVTHDFNRGLAAARNSGLEVAESSYVSFLDADDVLYPEHIQIVRKLAISRPDVIVIRAKLWYTEPSRIRTMRFLWHRLGMKRIRWRNDLHGPSVFRRQFLSEIGGYREGPLVEDWDLWIRIRSSSAFIRFAYTPTYLYRRHRSQLTRSPALLARNEATLRQALAETTSRWAILELRRGLRWQSTTKSRSQALEAIGCGDMKTALFCVLKSVRYGPIKQRLANLALLIKVLR